MALTSGSCGTHVDSCAQLARHSTGRHRRSGVELTCAMQDQSPPNPVPGLGSRCCLLRVVLRSGFFFRLWIGFFCRGLELHRRVSASNLERPCSGPASSGPVKLRHGRVLECPARCPPWLSVAFGLHCTFPGSPSLLKAVDHANVRLSGRRSSKHDQSRCVHRRGLFMSCLGKIIF